MGVQKAVEASHKRLPTPFYPYASWSGTGKHLWDVSRSVDDAMHQDGSHAHSIENEIVSDHKKPVAQAGQLLVVGYSPQVRMGGKPAEVFLDPIR